MISYLMCEVYFQILTSVLKENTIAVMMVFVIIPGDRTTVNVNRDILETEGIAKVYNYNYILRQSVINNSFSVKVYRSRITTVRVIIESFKFLIQTE